MEDEKFNSYINDILNPKLSLRELFEKKINQQGLTQFKVEKLLGIEYRSLLGILDKSAKRVSILNIIKLSDFLGLPYDEFIKLYVSELPEKTKGEVEKSARYKYLLSNFDLKNLHVGGFLKSRSVEYAEDRIRKFFGLAEITDYEKYKSIRTAFSRTKNKYKDVMRDFWVVSAHQTFEKIANPNPYNREELLKLIPKIRPYSKNLKKGLFSVFNALYRAGVTVIYQPHLPNVQVRGATFFVNGKPCVVITDVYKRYPTLWFALLHELYHVLFDEDDLRENIYHLSGLIDIFLLQEDAANEFSREYLFSYEKTDYIQKFIQDEFFVEEYAEECQVHRSIIYNFYLHDRKKSGDVNAWANPLKRYIPNSIEALEKINSHPWAKDTISESVDFIRDTVIIS